MVEIDSQLQRLLVIANMVVRGTCQRLELAPEISSTGVVENGKSVSTIVPSRPYSEYPYNIYIRRDCERQGPKL